MHDGTEPELIYIQFGGHTDCPEGWHNFDLSPYLRLSRVPIVGRLFSRFSPFDFPMAARI